MRHENKIKQKQFWITFLVTLTFCFLFKDTIQLQGEGHLQFSLLDAESNENIPFVYSSCRHSPIQFHFRCEKNAQGAKYMHYTLAPNILKIFDNNTIIEKFTILTSQGNTVEFKVNNISFAQSQITDNDTYISRAIPLNIADGEFAISLQLFDSKTDKFIGHTCNFTINSHGEITFNTKSIPAQKHNYFSV